MMKNYTILIALNIATLILPRDGVIVVPVTDLFGTPLTSTQEKSKTQLCGGKENFDESCLRMHQALFNERVEIIEEQLNWVKVQIKTAYYAQATSNRRNNTYWIKKNTLLPLTSAIDTQKFPPPVTENKTSNHDCATLRVPFFDSTTQHTYSAGTRFALIPENRKKKRLCNVSIFNPITQKHCITRIPKSSLVFDKNRSNDEKQALFTEILREWANQKKGIIPYVWGGCSFTHYYRQEPFSHATDGIHSYYFYQHNTDTIKRGFDCSNLITRAAQIAGIPFFLKNSYTIKTGLKPITPNTPIQNGDIIWIPGHVLVVSDIDKNLVIESSSYKYGTGRLQEIPISSIFPEIRNYSDMHILSISKQKTTRRNTLTRINEKRKIPLIVLQMKTIWD